MGLAETPEQKRLREVACTLADIGWRGHPDYRGDQAVDLIAYGSIVGVDHPGRAFLAQVLAVRYMGPKFRAANQHLLALAGADRQPAGEASSASSCGLPTRCRRR